MSCPRSARARLAALVMVALVGACDDCDGHGPEPASEEPKTAMPMPEPWVMGAAKGDVALPPPCRPRDDALTAVLGRESRLVSEPHSLGRILVAEGATHAVGERQPAHPALTLKRWAPDASGVITMRHGPTAVRPLPWPTERAPDLARAGEQWLALLERDRGGVRGLWLWRDGQEQRLGEADGLRPASLRCHGSSCALLTAPVDAAGAPTGRPGASLWLGDPADSVRGWRRVTIDQDGARPFEVTGLRAEDDGVTAYATVMDDLRARVVEVKGERWRVVAEPSAPHGVVATTLAAEPVVTAFAGPRGPQRCDAAGGGVFVTVGGREAVHLRSALPADRGHVHALEGGALVTWLAPARCGGPRRLLHATVIDDRGRPAAPVTVVGEAASYAVATEGRRVDLWLRRTGGVDGPGDMGTVIYLRAECPVGG